MAGESRGFTDRSGRHGLRASLTRWDTPDLDAGSYVSADERLSGEAHRQASAGSDDCSQRQCSEDTPQRSARSARDQRVPNPLHIGPGFE